MFTETFQELLQELKNKGISSSLGKVGYSIEAVSGYDLVDTIKECLKAKGSELSDVEVEYPELILNDPTSINESVSVNFSLPLAFIELHLEDTKTGICAISGILPTAKKYFIGGEGIYYEIDEAPPRKYLKFIRRAASAFEILDKLGFEEEPFTEAFWYDIPKLGVRNPFLIDPIKEGYVTINLQPETPK